MFVKMFANKGASVIDQYQRHCDLDAARTQFRFKIDSTKVRLAQVLGCYQIVTFGEYEQELRHLLEKYLGISVR
jgi:hypothetical protein